MKLYIYIAKDYSVAAIISGESAAACERKARELNYDDEIFESTYSPRFGMTDGLRENPEAEQIQA
jgi:hypothetical protein